MQHRIDFYSVHAKPVISTVQPAPQALPSPTQESSLLLGSVRPGGIVRQQSWQRV